MQGSQERTWITLKPKIKLSQVSEEKGSIKSWQDEKHELLILAPGFELGPGVGWGGICQTTRRKVEWVKQNNKNNESACTMTVQIKISKHIK